MNDDWVYCPVCGPAVKFFKRINGAQITGEGIEKSCRRCKRKILIFSDGKTKVIPGKSA